MISAIRAFAAVLAVLTAPALASAQMFSLTGRVATGSGTFIRLPAIGTSCPSVTANIATGTTIPQKYRAPITQSMAVLNPGGCIPAPTAATITTTGSGGFMLPVAFFSQPTTGMLRVAPVPPTPMVPQLASSFAFTGPANLSSPFEAQNPVKAGTAKFVAAQWNLFRPNAHLTAAGTTGAATFTKPVTVGTNLMSPGTTPTTRNTLNMYVSGRTSKDFTACATMVAANVACTFPTQGVVIPGMVRNIAGSNVFGGTMGLVLTTGTNNVSSVAVTVGGTPMQMTGVTRGPVLLNVLAGMGSRLNGRGYAATDTDALAAGQIFMTHMLTTFTPISSNRVIGMVTGFVAPGATGSNQNYGFPWSTGTQLIRGTGTSLAAGPGGGTFSLMGFDNRTAMGLGNIQLVSGGLAQSSIQGPNGTPNYSVMRLEFAPEPGAVTGLLAGAGLLGVVAWRRRQTR